MSATTMPELVSLEALAWPSKGLAYDLCSGYWPGMPLSAGHPPFQVITYRTPRGERNQRDLRFLDDNPNNFGFISELVMGTQHTGTHIDARGHITAGPESTWWGGHSADTDLGDFGLLNNDAAGLKPIFCRGYLLDVPASSGREHLGPNEPIVAADLARTAETQGIEVSSGAAIMVRTGMMSLWPDAAALSAVADAGVSLDGAEWLAAHDPVVVGADTPAFEVAPSGIPGEPQPAHRFLLPERGIPIMEWVYLEGLARARAYEFLFVCIPLPIRGATGSMVRPLAIV